ncbi:MAG: hypothetical protein U0521_09555 [Anaerolineae bacterium]
MVLLVVVVGYVALYWRACPPGSATCRGLRDRAPGVPAGASDRRDAPGARARHPRPQAIVDCDTCRSVLREVGRGRWRYAVDRAANPVLYNQPNGRVISADMLRALEESAPREAPPVRPPARPPTFVDDEE